MIAPLKNFFTKIAALLGGFGSFFKRNKLGIFSFLFSFTVIVTFIDMTLTRNAAIREIKKSILTWQNYLNEAGLDIAYENIRFNNIFIYPLLEIDGLQIYNLKGEHLWSFKTDKLSFRLGWLNSKKLKAGGAAQSVFLFDGKAHPIALPGISLTVSTSSDGAFKDLQLDLKDSEIKDFAKVRELTFALRRHKLPEKTSALFPSFESHLEIKDVAINGLRQYPLTSKIGRIYAKFNLRGQIKPDEFFAPAVETWLHEGGFIAISNLIVHWPPLILVGRGDINFSEDFAPRVHVKTSSKAFLNLLEDLNKNESFERKGLFVSKILLSNKAFKLRDNDQYLTVTTPVDYRDGKLTVENIPVMTLRK